MATPLGLAVTSILTEQIADFDPFRSSGSVFGTLNPFRCGPGDFAATLADWLETSSVPPERIHTEQFGKSARVINPLPFPAWQARNEAVAVRL